MKIELQVCLLLGLLSSSFGDLDFYECGSEDIEIESIDMEACLHTPCSVIRGRTYRITVHPDQRSPPVGDVDVSARALIRGAAFPVNAYAVSPCKVGATTCQLKYGQDQSLEIIVTVTASLLRGPAPLIINATYLRRGVPTCRFCFEFDVNIF